MQITEAISLGVFLTMTERLFLTDRVLAMFNSQTFLMFAQTDMALLHTVLLSIRSLFAWHESAVSLLELEARTVVEIKEALKESMRATSDQLIIAVAIMASYDLQQGNEDKFNTHMAGLLQMIALRGGLRELRFKDALEGLVILMVSMTQDRGWQHPFEELTSLGQPCRGKGRIARHSGTEHRTRGATVFLRSNIYTTT